MKRIYQLFSLMAVMGLLTLLTANTADAQRGGGGSRGGGGFHGGGGGFSGGSRGGFGGGSQGGFGGSRGGFGGGFSGGNRGSFQGGSFNHGGGQVQQSPRSGQSFGGFNRGGTQISPRSGNSFGGGFQGGNRGGYAYGNRGSYSYSNRGSVRGGFSYGSPGYRGGFGYRGGSYYRGGIGIGGYRSPFRGGAYYHGGFYGRYYAPRIGFRLNILPYGYYPFYYGPDQFYYSGGYFYQYNNNEYTVVEPPLGAEVNALPSDAQSVVIDNQQYYEANGVYYLPITRDDGTNAYQVVGKDGHLDTGAGQYQQGDYQGDQAYQDNQNNQPQDNTYAPQSSEDQLQPGEVVQALPPNTRKVKVNGETYHVDPAGIYYHEERDQNGRKVYRVTDVDPNQN